jgi:hypothetical protein
MLIAQADSIWSSESNSCLVPYSERNFANLTVTLVEDSVLLVLMLSGLRRYGGLGMAGIWRLLYRQVSGPRFYAYRNMNGYGIGIVVARPDHRRRNTCRCTSPFVLSDPNVLCIYTKTAGVYYT